ncbi:autotransporter domain-containing protein [Bordetella sp. LUAb4]|uniref:autotransporter domain-containing protein n=1 Tax=Bordetella sp. LUAb4 TaxID=2843195 RepID=UPI001E4E63D2|nr:autotransporter domain-containing protein [Bordetella sp. LUAb4]
MEKAFSLYASVAIGLTATSVDAQSIRLTKDDLQKRANGVLALMSFSIVPDITTSSLSIGSGNATATSGSSEFFMTQLGGGDTISKSVPIYLEGVIAASRYDPTFVATQGTEQRRVPTRWNSLSATGGIGYDFKLTDELKLRPIFNVALGNVTSDLRAASWYVGKQTDKDINFLDRGSLNAYGLGGSLMLDYEHYRPGYEVDVELRYSDIRLKSFESSAAVQGNAAARSANLWARYRAPTGATLLQRPLRYVLELTHSEFLGDQKGALGFDRLTSVGLGLELDSSAYKIPISRTRLVGRYVTGKNVSGFSIGLAVSF